MSKHLIHIIGTQPLFSATWDSLRHPPPRPHAVPSLPLRASQHGAHASSIASLDTISPSNGSLDDGGALSRPHHGGPVAPSASDSPELSGPLGQSLDQLAEQLSSSTLFGGTAATPANTLMSRTVAGASLGSEDTYRLGLSFGTGRAQVAARQQQQLGELAAMSELLAARLELLGVGHLGSEGDGVGRGDADATDSQASHLRGAGGGGGGGGGGSGMSSANFSPRLDPPGVASAATAMSRYNYNSLRLSSPGPTAPTARTLLWAGAAEGLARSLTGALGGVGGGTGSVATTPGTAAVLGGALGSTTRSAADSPLMGSANAEALAGFILPQQVQLV